MQATAHRTSKPEGRTWRFGWLPAASAMLSLLACYGTLALVTVLSLAGIGLAVNVHVWAAAIVAFAVIAAAGIWANSLRHGKPMPFVAACLGTLLIVLAMYGSEAIHALAGVSGRATELAGFAALFAAALWDWRSARACRQG